MSSATARLERARERLAPFPRIALGHYPTPVEPLGRLAAALGTPDAVLTKRDDASGLGMGGNKVRKLEYLLGDARARGADVVLTTGALQSNHARQTAAAAARLGLACELVLPHLVPRSGPAYERNGNRLLDGLLGARVFEVEDVAAAARAIAERVAHARDGGHTLYAIPPGGSTPVGCLGFVSGALELYAQVQQQGLEIGRLYVAVSSGGTLAGLLAGLALVGWDVPVTGVCVYEGRDATGQAVRRLLDELVELLDLGAVPDFRLRDDCIGEGYGIPTPAGTEALVSCARQEGLLLDPVYTAKAMAALFDDHRAGRAPARGASLFWHTGGAPALFAYPDAVPAEPDGSPGR